MTVLANKSSCFVMLQSQIQASFLKTPLYCVLGLWKWCVPRISGETSWGISAVHWEPEVRGHCGLVTTVYHMHTQVSRLSHTEIRLVYFQGRKNGIYIFVDALLHDYHMTFLTKRCVMLSNMLALQNGHTPNCQLKIESSGNLKCLKTTLLCEHTPWD